MHARCSLPSLLNACFLMCCLALCVSACVEGSEPVGLEITTYSAMHPGPPQATPIVDTGSNLSPEDRARYDQLYATFTQNAPRLLTQDDVPLQYMESIEKAYLSDGRALDLAAIYRRSVDESGMESGVAAPRLAWLLVRLGQEKEALSMIEALIRARPERADPWFLYGAYWLKEAAESKDALKRALVGWGRALRLDPSYQGFEGIDAKTIRSQLSAMRLRALDVSPADLEAIEQDLLPAAAPAAPSPESGDLTEAPSPSIAQPSLAQDAPEAQPSVAEPAAPQQAQAQPVAEAQPATPERDDPDALPILVGRAQLARGDGDEAAAARFVRRAVTKHVPDKDFVRAVKGTAPPSRAMIDLIRLARDLDIESTRATQALRALSTREDLSTARRYAIATYLWRTLDDRASALAAFELIAERDPAFSSARNLPVLIEQLRARP